MIKSSVMFEGVVEEHRAQEAAPCSPGAQRGAGGHSLTFPHSTAQSWLLDPCPQLLMEQNLGRDSNEGAAPAPAPSKFTPAITTPPNTGAVGHANISCGFSQSENL